MGLKAYEKGKIDQAPTKDVYSPWYGRKEEYIEAKSAFYQCYKCTKPFFGGMADCERDLQMAENTKKEDLLCRKCVASEMGVGQFNCPVHGHKFITWKCSKCCNEALFRCGPHYFCDSCHGNEDAAYEPFDCHGVVEDCPLGVPHPPNNLGPIKSMYPLGCALCRKKTYDNAGADRNVCDEGIEENEDDILNIELQKEFARHNPLKDHLEGEGAKRKLWDKLKAEREKRLAEERDRLRKEKAEKDKIRAKIIENKNHAEAMERMRLKKRLEDEQKYTKMSNKKTIK